MSLIGGPRHPRPREDEAVACGDEYAWALLSAVTDPPTQDRTRGEAGSAS